jgi:hypothetical protein
MKKSRHRTFLDFLRNGRKTKEKNFSPMSVQRRDEVERKRLQEEHPNEALLSAKEQQTQFLISFNYLVGHALTLTWQRLHSHVFQHTNSSSKDCPSLGRPVAFSTTGHP